MNSLNFYGILLNPSYLGVTILVNYDIEVYPMKVIKSTIFFMIIWSGLAILYFTHYYFEPAKEIQLNNMQIPTELYMFKHSDKKIIKKATIEDPYLIKELVNQFENKKVENLRNFLLLNYLWQRRDEYYVIMPIYKGTPGKNLNSGYIPMIEIQPNGNLCVLDMKEKSAHFKNNYTRYSFNISNETWNTLKKYLEQ